MPTTTDSAVLRVLVTSALGAFPLSGASVTVSTAADEDGTHALLYAVTTDQSGLTPPMTLPTPPRANSLSPDGGRPYALYTVSIAADGYTPRTVLHVPMFAGVPTVLPAPLTPLPENTPRGQTDLLGTGDPQSLTRAPETGEEG